MRGFLRPFAVVQILSVVCLVGATLLSLVDPLILKWLIDKGLQQRRAGEVAAAVLVFVLAYVCRSLLLLIGNLVATKTIQLAMLCLRVRLFRKLQTLDASFYDKTPTGDLVQTLERDVDRIGELGVDLVPTFVRIIVSVTVTAGIMFALDTRLSCVVIPTVPLLLFLRARFRSLLEHAADVARGSSGERASFLVECLGGIVPAQLLGIERKLIRKYTVFAVDAIRANYSQRRTELLYSASSLAAFALVTAAVLAAGATRVMAGHLTLGGYVAFYSYLMRLFDPLYGAVETYSGLKRAGGSIRLIAQLENRVPSVVDCKSAPTLSVSEVSEASCRNVSFKYGNGPVVLHDVSLAIRKGHKVALVGPSGSGKSTIGRLMVRLYETHTGAVELNGSDTKALNLGSLRSAISLVSQSPFLFRGTIRENVLLGGAPAAGQELARLAEVACFDSVVTKFANGWDHKLGAGGAGLSDGEKQRLALLRALLQDRPILILDEVTSSLDPILERDLLSRLDQYVHDRAVLVVSHRLPAIRWADWVLVIRNGEIVRSCHPMDLDHGIEVEMRVWGPQSRGNIRQGLRPVVADL
jgi:ATP-binding cassette subfamily B multidrug efflux pump